MNMLMRLAVPMHGEGRTCVAIFAAIALCFVWKPLFWPGLGVTLWCSYFFRDRVCVIPRQDGIELSSADGILSWIETGFPMADLRAPALARCGIAA